MIDLSNRDQFHRYIKQGKYYVNEGNFKRAEHSYWLALELATDYDHPSRKDIGLVEHRMAELSARYGDVSLARWRFRKAATRISDNPVGLAICLRDHANFEFLQHERRAARKLLKRALFELNKAGTEVAPSRLEVEISVTRAFVAGIDIADKKNISESIKQLKETDSLLRKYKKKPAYELANLVRIVNALPRGDERNLYLERARELSWQLGNYYKWGGFTSLKLGKPVYVVYQATTSIASFGLKNLKGISRKTSI